MGFSYSSKLGDGTGIGDDGFSYNPVTDTLDVGTLTANNVVVTALATPTVTSVTPTLTQVGTINVVAGASLVDGDYFTIDYGSGTIPIEFEATPPNGTTGGRIPFTFAPGDAAGTIRDGLIALINLAAPTKVVASIGGAAAITVSMVTPGEAGGVITENVANAGFTVVGFANPTAATTYGYRVDSFLADGKSSGQSAEVTTAAGHATLSASNFVTVVFAPSAGSTSTRLYRTTGGTAPPKLLYTGTATSYVDVGDAGTAETPSTVNGTGVVTAGRVLIGNGTAAAPSLAFAAESGTGIYWNTTGTIGMRGGGANAGAFSNTAAAVAPSLALGFGANLFLTNAAAATLQLGAANAASPIAQTLKVQDATGSNANGAASFKIQAPAGRGTGTIGEIEFQTPTPAASGDNAQTQTTRLKVGRYTTTFSSDPVPNSDDTRFVGDAGGRWAGVWLSRAILGGKPKVLVDASATAFATVALADGAATGGKIIYRVVATDGSTARQVVSGSLNYAAARNGATYAVDYDEVQQSTAVTTGTLTGTVTAAGASDLLTFSANFDTSLGTPVLTIYYRFDSTDTLTPTPL